jgi:hypothetical protein
MRRRIRWLGKVRRRQFAFLCELTISTSNWQQPLLAKVALSADEIAQPKSVDRVGSYFVGAPDPLGGEYAALRSVERHFQRLNDSRLFTVRVLDSLFEGRGLLLEKVDAQPLTHLLKSASRLGRWHASPRLLDAVHSAGVCLRSFHQLPIAQRRKERGVTKHDFLAWVDAGQEFLAADSFSRSFFQVVGPRLRDAAEHILPDQLPIGPVHDDFAPRNVLLAADGRVAVIDMLEQWTGCIWEDISHFLVAIGANKLQSISGGRAFAEGSINGIQEYFLRGYYGNQAIPLAAIAVYESQATLTKWAAWIYRTRNDKGWRAALRRTPLGNPCRWYAKYVEQCLRRAEQACEEILQSTEMPPQFSAEGAP